MAPKVYYELLTHATPSPATRVPVPLHDRLERGLCGEEPLLYEEPLHLLREEQGIREPGTYFALVREVAAGRTTVSEIANGTRVSVPNLTKMLRRLVELSYLEARAPRSAGALRRRASCCSGPIACSPETVRRGRRARIREDAECAQGTGTVSSRAFRPRRSSGLRV